MCKGYVEKGWLYVEIWLGGKLSFQESIWSREIIWIVFGWWVMEGWFIIILVVCG